MDTTVKAVGIIDAQRGFMPAEEAERLNLPGFGELPIERGQRIVPNVNALLDAAEGKRLPSFTTQDWHPLGTAHFSSEPNFTTTWPQHCVENTPGAELHPHVRVPKDTEAFKKGNEVLARGEDDTSYSGTNGFNADGERLGAWLRGRNVTEVVLGGLALDYCVKATALGLKEEGFDVTVAIDATAAVLPKTGADAIHALEKAGVKLMRTEDYLKRLETIADEIKA